MKNYFAITMLSLMSLGADADQPLPPPEVLTVCSNSREYCAISDPTKSATRVGLEQDAMNSWTIPGWHRWIFVSDEGDCAVVGYWGMNLVPPDVSLDEKVLFFYCLGVLVREVRLKDLYTDKSQLGMTASHLSWVRSIRFNRANQLVVDLVNRKRLAFSAKTGLIEELIPDDT